LPLHYEEVRREAINALGAIGKKAKSALPSLLKIIENNVDADTRSIAVSAIYRVAPKDVRTIATLSRAIIDTSPRVRVQAVKGLGLIGASKEDTNEALVKIYEEEGSFIVREEIMTAFGNVGFTDTKGLFHVISKALHDRFYKVRLSAIKALLKFDISSVYKGYMTWTPEKQQDRIEGYMLCVCVKQEDCKGCYDVGNVNEYGLGKLPFYRNEPFFVRIVPYDVNKDKIEGAEIKWDREDLFQTIQNISFNDQEIPEMQRESADLLNRYKDYIVSN